MTEFISPLLADLPAGLLLATLCCFVWSGFVRSGLGFGGAALTLPMLLMIVNDPLQWLPAICWHLLFFSLLTVVSRLDRVNWRWLRKLILLLAVPFAAGLAGLLNLPGDILSLLVYAITLGYGLMYALNRVVVSRGGWSDGLCILIGGYVGGVSLIGAPLIAAVAARQLQPAELRDTLFVLWIVLVVAKLGAFVVTSVNLQWQLALWTLPLVALGHVLGLRAHHYLVTGNRRRFNQVIGVGLSAVSLLGLSAAL